VLATATEELRGFQPKIAEPLPDAVDDGIAVPFGLLGILLLFCLLLFLRSVQPLLALGLSVSRHFGEVALLEVFDVCVLGQHILKGLPEVVDENLLCLVRRALH